MSWRDPHFVYLIGYGGAPELDGPVKVGVSRDPDKRARELQTGNPNELTPIHYFKVKNYQRAVHLERAFMNANAKHRMMGEWFDMCPKEALNCLCNLVAEDCPSAPRLDVVRARKVLAFAGDGGIPL